MRRFLRPQAVALPLAVVLLVGAACSTSASPFHRSSVSSGSWRLVWSDEFNGRAGSQPSPSKWVYDLGGEPNWGNQEWEYYTNRPQNVSMDGQGHLVITARRKQLPGMSPCEYGPCNITSGRITTLGKFSQAYGRFEARIKIPAGQGMWPAFWMLGDNIASVGWPNSGELDVMENIGREPATVYGTAHGPGYASGGIGGNYTLPNGRRLADAFHVYAVEWTPTQIAWFLDGTRYFTLNKTDLAAGQEWVFDHPFYLLLNLAVGGTWPGPPDQSTVFPAKMVIDDVRVYTRAG